MTEQLEPSQQQQGDEVAHVQAVGGRIEAGVDGDRALAESLAQSVEVGVVVHQPACRQIVEDFVAGPGLLGHGGHSPATRRLGPFGYERRSPAQ